MLKLFACVLDSRLRGAWILFFATILRITPALAQLAAPQAMNPAQHMEHNADPAAAELLRFASGTSMNPSMAPHQMFTREALGWTWMGNGEIYLNTLQQSGPRGGGKFFSANRFMGQAQRSLGKGSILLRSMLSLEPATVTKQYYPLLFQTGETVFGKPLVDGQHPHDFVMELGVQYARPLAEGTLLSLYFAPVGDAALGPVAFPHRASAAELPQATLGHHLQDSSHIANEVLTVGVRHRFLRVEASGFHGAEPNETRWNIDHGSFDSWSVRATLFPSDRWIAQASLGRLRKPEKLEPGDIMRATASLSFRDSLPGGSFDGSIIWGRNHKTVNGQNLNSYLAEAVYRFRQVHAITGRIESVDKDELFAADAHDAARQDQKSLDTQVFRVQALMLGYSRQLAELRYARLHLGGNFTIHRIPDQIKARYGETPIGGLVFLVMHFSPPNH
ncbi:MAG: hypothetical protein EXQ56_08065 [Acidobacteria bacterium]|nr:hypothetical protein [Acidobacteriota bacterium]